MTTIIRLATEHDAEQILTIYTPFVANTATSFELVPPTVQEMQQRIAGTLTAFPWLVCAQHEKVLGYAYASKHRVRAAYQWSADTSVYVHPDIRRAGVGRALYSSLFRILALQGIYNLYAGVALPNPASVGLHEAMGFQPIGVYRAVGYKLGAWHDVGWWHLPLQERPADPQPPLALEAVRTGEAWDTALAAGLPYLRV